MTRPLPTWLRRTIGILAVGGGGVGIATTLVLLVQTEGMFLKFLCLVFCAMFAVGIFFGTMVLEGNERAARWSIPFWFAQVPMFKTGLVTYEFYTGLRLLPWLQPFDGSFGLQWNVGAGWQVRLLQPTDMVVGVNLVALAIALALLWQRRQIRQAEASRLAPGAA